jgi:hypothetical protein
MVSSCQTCKHIYPYRKGEPRGCAAYPDGIPIWFASGDVEHINPVGNEKDGILYEPLETNG